MTVEHAEIKRNPGRRTADYVRQKSVWLLVIGALFQGGFALLAWKLVSIGEKQMNQDRELFVQQHGELLARIQGLEGRLWLLETEAAKLNTAAGTVQGMVLGRLHCPDLTCAPCRRCADIPAPIIITTPAATVAPQPGSPKEVEKPVDRRDSRGRVVK
jgi:hypothetical protein